MTRWYLHNNPDKFNRLNEYASLTSIQKLILANRDIVEKPAIEAFINPGIEGMYNPLLMLDLEKACNIIFDNLMAGSHIKIVGDYDQDGVAATTILYKGLTLFEGNVTYQIPDRVEDGYGLNKQIVDKCVRQGVDLIITCDNGISAFEAIEYAKENNIQVIITDHHQVKSNNGEDIIPSADAVVNPSQQKCNYPFKYICGALVAYKIIDGLYRLYGQDLGIEVEDIYDLLQYAALGTISDVMDIVDENRLVVVEGLKRLNKTKNTGLRELLNQLNWNREIDIYTVGFIIGPIVNASGRIFTAKLAVEMFLENDINLVKEYVAELIALNEERKKMTLEAFERAIENISKNKSNDKIIIYYDPGIHESICGLVAGRIKEIYNRPTIVLTDSDKEDGSNILKGSGRSIEAYNMHEKMSEVKDLFVSFGGHKMACGLSIKEENLSVFKDKILKSCILEDHQMQKTIDIDASLDFRQINMELIEQINQLKPFGKGFEKPKFASKNVIINNIGIIGKNRNVLKIQFMQNDIRLEAISFNIEPILSILESKFNNIDARKNLGAFLRKSIDILYTLSINEFNGRKTIQLNLEDIR